MAFPGIPEDVCNAIIEDDPVELKKIRPEISDELNDFALSLLRKKPENRPSADEILIGNYSVFASKMLLCVHD